MHEDPDEPPTDVLAAEEFVVPAPDPALTPEELDLPADLAGDEPRDVLIAEEFAMPSPDEARVPPPPERRILVALTPRALAALVLTAVGGRWLWRRLRRR